PDNFQIIWSGSTPTLDFREMAAYCAPILWFSPDEPSLEDRTGKDIMIPAAFPFEAAPSGPVVYYRLRTVLTRGEGAPAISGDLKNRVDTRLDLSRIAGLDIDYFFYYPREEGLGAHKHDVEALYLKVYVHHCENCPEQKYALYIERAVGKAHGLLWYDNTLVTDAYTKFPVTILVEEGKHASCTDKNQDGIYTPTFDVNRRINDAWGVRDIMRGGGLYKGSFQAWMTKQRIPEHRVFPPLPVDSYLRAAFSRDGVYAPDNAIYELRPFPRPEAVDTVAEPTLLHFIDDKGDENWPKILETADLRAFTRWIDGKNFTHSLSIAYRVEGQNSGESSGTEGLSFIFPLLVIKNVSDPITGGWLVNRIYIKDDEFQDVSWNLLYTPSASRWMDGYFAFGWEWDKDQYGDVHTDVMTETGVKFRLNLNHTPLRFLSHLGTDFWGLRFGIKNEGVLNWNGIGYVFEVGAGVW
ncbi:hypothetical protein CSB20_14690, partial [bacterium DOLZORAL124_64_63]